VSAGSVVLFPKGAIHMLHNTGDEEMDVVCFFAPPTGLDNYVTHEGVDFPIEARTIRAAASRVTARLKTPHASDPLRRSAARDPGRRNAATAGERSLHHLEA
jgi:hypothetical protein